MGKVQYYCAATLDGFIAETNDSIDWLTGYQGSSEIEGAVPGPMGPGNAYEQFYEGVGALISGSTTYEFVIGHMGEGGDWPYPGKPYWVLSSRDLPVPDGDGVDVRMANGDVRGIHEELLESAGEGHLWVVGGGNVASQFAAAGLLDELIVTVVPVVLGSGKPLFDDRLAGEPLKLTGARTFTTGMVELLYAL